MERILVSVANKLVNTRGELVDGQPKCGSDSESGKLQASYASRSLESVKDLFDP